MLMNCTVVFGRWKDWLLSNIMMGLIWGEFRILSYDYWVFNVDSLSALLTSASMCRQAKQ